jgi:hypothetical protein
MKIRFKTGEVMDLALLRAVHAQCKRDDCLMQDLLDALEAALQERSADDLIGSRPISTDPVWHRGWKGGWYAHGVAVRAAAGVVE